MFPERPRFRVARFLVTSCSLGNGVQENSYNSSQQQIRKTVLTKAVVWKINYFAKKTVKFPLFLSEHREELAIRSACLGYTSALCKPATPMVVNTESHAGGGEGTTQNQIFLTKPKRQC